MNCNVMLARRAPAQLSRAHRVSPGYLPYMSHREEPWLMRTYVEHTNPRTANELFRKNLAKGQTGLSVAFDLPTQTGYDSDDPMAVGEVGKVGVPVCYITDAQAPSERTSLNPSAMLDRRFRAGLFSGGIQLRHHPIRVTIL